MSSISWNGSSSVVFLALLGLGFGLGSGFFTVGLGLGFGSGFEGLLSSGVSLISSLVIMSFIVGSAPSSFFILLYKDFCSKPDRGLEISALHFLNASRSITSSWFVS